mgnify:CR=1 FL=1
MAEAKRIIDGVPRRIGGLEMQLIPQLADLIVPRRIGGLENRKMFSLR